MDKLVLLRRAQRWGLMYSRVFPALHNTGLPGVAEPPLGWVPEVDLFEAVPMLLPDEVRELLAAREIQACVVRRSAVFFNLDPALAAEGRLGGGGSPMPKEAIAAILEQKLRGMRSAFSANVRALQADHRLDCPGCPACRRMRMLP